MTSKEALEILVKQANERKLSNKIVANGIAVSLLEKLVERDTPKKPLLVEVSADNEHHYECLYCGATINIGSSITYNKVFNIFCRECGQRLDWSE